MAESAGPSRDAAAKSGSAAGSGAPRPARTDHSPWNWLLLLPIVIPLLTPLFNAEAPEILGFPRFYWLQFAFIALGVTCTSVVYQATKRRR